ncbi:MAG: hypothetical protein ABEN55_21135 [Bradymonadaceae bacterium]
MNLKARRIQDDRTKLDGPFEMPCCGGHLGVDGTYLDQASDYITCPYCKAEDVYISEEDQNESEDT